MKTESIVESIKRLCKNRNITLTKLEEDLSMSQGLISRWTRTDPSLSKIINIADYFNISLDDLVRGRKTNDDFLLALIDKTQNKSITWHTYDRNRSNLDIKVFTANDSVHHSYDEEEYEESTYYTEYNKGFISIYSLHKIKRVTQALDLYIFIQPDMLSDFICQDYSKEEITELYVKVLNSLHDDAPIEIKAEALKMSFIKDFKE